MFRDLPSFKSLIALEAVVRLGSGKAAAEELCVSHSAISQGIKQLENELGSPLFNRRGRRLQASEGARRLASVIGISLNQLLQSYRFLKLQGSPNSLSLKMVSTLALRWFIPKLPALQDALPNMRVKLVTEPSSSPGYLPANIDAAVGFAKNSDFDEQYFYQLRPSELVLVTLLEDSLEFDQLFKQKTIIRVTGNLRSSDWDVWCDKSRVSLPQAHQCIEMNSSAQALEAVSAGAGVLVTQKIFVENLLNLNHFKILGEPVVNNNEGYYFYCRQENSQLPGVRALASWIKSQENKEIPTQ